jgi:hypothetical protein
MGVVRRTTIHHRLYRVRARLRRFVCRLRGRHTEEGGDWGYAMREQFGQKGIVELFCPNCMQLVRCCPLEDFDSMDEVLAALTTIRKE